MKEKIIHSQSGSISPWGRSKASILLFTLWALFLLAVFGVYLGRGVRQRIELVKSITTRRNLYCIAEAGIQKGIFELMKDQTVYDALGEEWSNNPAEFQDIKVGLGKFNVGYDYYNKEGEEEFWFGIADEERKININTSSRLIIQKLFEVVTGVDETKAQELAASIVDWRDKDSFLSIPIGSAEDMYYNSREEPYDSKDAEFQVYEELLLVKGMDKELYDKIKRFITLYGNGVININTASHYVLLALGIDEILIDKIIAYREGDDEMPGTADDNIFDISSNIVATLSQSYSLSPSEVSTLSNLVSGGVLGTNSYNFMIDSTATIGAMKKEIVCVVNREGKVISWREQ